MATTSSSSSTASASSHASASTDQTPRNMPTSPVGPGLLAGKRVLVTGAASGIGRASALLAAAQGAMVCAADLDGEALRALYGDAPSVLPDAGHALSVTMDVGDSASVQAAYAEIDRVLGGVDALIHCAGIWRTKEDRGVTRVAESVWDETLRVNLTGTFLVCREAITRMEKQGAGSVVTIASVAALVGFERITAYTASKGGVVALTRAMAIDCAPKNIRVNCLCPGVIQTNMTAKVLEHAPPAVLPLGRLGEADEIARTAVFLCSDWSSFTTASTVVVDGGFTAA